MNEPGAPAPRCARHLDAPASFTCARCGSFGCTDCERRASLDALPVCPSCWAVQSAGATASQSSGTGLQTAGLVLGILSIIPCCPLSIASLVVNIVAIVQAQHPPAREVRWKPIVGLLVTLGVTVLQVLFVALYNVFARAE